MSSCEPALVVKNLRLEYPPRVLIENFNDTIKTGCFLALIGENGSGKSSLLRTISGMQKAKTGLVKLFGKEIRRYSSKELALKRSFLSSEKAFAEYLKVKDFIEGGRFPHQAFLLKKEDKEITKKVMNECGISHLAESYLSRLSDGEKQKAGFARNLAQDSPVMILDEPAAYLDMKGKNDVFKILKQKAKNENKLVIVSTHDLNQVLKFADYIWMLKDKRIKKGKPEALSESGAFSYFFDNAELVYQRETKTLHFK